MIDRKTFLKTTSRGGGDYVVDHVSLPVCCWEGIPKTLEDVNWEGTVLVDIWVRDGCISSITPSGKMTQGRVRMDAEAAIVLPTFVDLHTHIDKGHTAERSMNTLGSLSGADRSTAADAMFWDAEDVELRMDFSVRCAYAHGTSALRTHLINMTDKHTALTWPAFAKYEIGGKEKWNFKACRLSR